MKRSEKSSVAQFDLLQNFLSNTEIKANATDRRNHFKLFQLSDLIIVEECEEKFQDFFIKQKRKGKCEESILQRIFKMFSQDRPISDEAERSLNGEMVEIHQEEIIEQEEFSSPNQKAYDKTESKEKIGRRPLKLRKSSIGIVNQIGPIMHSLSIPSGNSHIGGWFKPGKIDVMECL